MNPIKTFNVVFDIDNVLTDTQVHNINEIKFYQEKGFVLTAIKSHYIFPGVIEIMQSLFRMSDVKVSFFSSGHQSRNELFVKKLLERSLGEDHYLRIKSSVRILSGKKDEEHTDLVENTKEESQIQWSQYGLHFGNQKKSLKKIIGTHGDLENCVLIDDDPSWIKCGEERNYLYVPSLNASDFLEMKRRSKYYHFNEYGQQKIPFRDCTTFQNIEYLKNCVINAEYISLKFEIEKCTLGYVDVDQIQYAEIEIFQESNQEIFEAAKKHYQKIEYKENGDQNIKTITKDELDLALYSFIEKKNGKTASIDLKCNRICYVAGLLFKALESARTGSNLTNFLFPIHFQKKSNSENFEPRFQTDVAYHKREEYYYYGLEKLKQVNPNFTFINPKIYKECYKKEITSAELDALRKIHENEEKCIIM